MLRFYFDSIMPSHRPSYIRTSKLHYKLSYGQAFTSIICASYVTKRQINCDRYRTRINIIILAEIMNSLHEMKNKYIKK